MVQQSVTMFPVLISISNEQGLLLPGMNGEVTMLVDERDDVLAVPLDAVRSVRELSTGGRSARPEPRFGARAASQRQVAAPRRPRAGGGQRARAWPERPGSARRRGAATRRAARGGAARGAGWRRDRGGAGSAGAGRRRIAGGAPGAGDPAARVAPRARQATRRRRARGGRTARAARRSCS